jgi:hypothetical protein
MSHKDQGDEATPTRVPYNTYPLPKVILKNLDENRDFRREVRDNPIQIATFGPNIILVEAGGRIPKI